MIRQNVPLKEYSNYHIGGSAAYFLEFSSEQELIDGLKEWKRLAENFPEEKKRIFVLGKGTNVLISEKGFPGLIIHNVIKGIEKNGEEITVGAGELVSDVLNVCIKNSLSGLEWAGGLPGTIGGAVRGNAGAFKGETKDSVSEVISFETQSLVEKKRNNLQCLFDYRDSIFKSGEAKNEVILYITFKLQNKNKEKISQAIQEKIDYRNEKHPMEYRSIGSTFKNVSLSLIPVNIKNELSQYVKDDPFPVIPVAKLLYLCDLKGKRVGDAQISEKHPNFIVNLGNAKYQDVKTLIGFAKTRVKEKFGITLEEEIIYLE